MIDDKFERMRENLSAWVQEMDAREMVEVSAVADELGKLIEQILDKRTHGSDQEEQADSYIDAVHIMKRALCLCLARNISPWGSVEARQDEYESGCKDIADFLMTMPIKQDMFDKYKHIQPVTTRRQ
jgi:hypothetical protein